MPGESHGQRSLAGYSPQGRKELNMTELTERSHTKIINIILFDLLLLLLLSCLSRVRLCDLMDCSPPGSSVHEILQVCVDHRPCLKSLLNLLHCYFCF